MTKPIVVFIARSHPIWGGVEKWLSDLIAGLRFESTNFAVKLILLEGNSYNKPDKFAAAQNITDYQIVTVKSGSQKNKLSILKNEIVKLSPNVVIPVLSLEALECAASLKARMGFSIVLPIHEYVVDVSEDIVVFAKYIDRIVTVDELNKLFLPYKCGVDKNLFSSIPGSYRREFVELLPKPFVEKFDSFKIGIASRFNVEKGKEVLIKALGLLKSKKDIQVWWAGLEESEIAGIEPLQSLHRNNQLVCLGAVKPEAMTDFHRSIDCLLIASELETGPLIAWDAMIANNVLLVSNYIGSLAEGLLIDQENCFQFERSDPNSLADALNRMLRDTEHRERVLKNAYQTVISKRNHQNFIGCWRVLLEQCISPGKSTSYRFKIWCWFQGRMASIKENYLLLTRRSFLPSSAREEWKTHLRASQSQVDYLEEIAQFEAKLFSWQHTE